jgi:RuvB-like protein 1 (pontin 52)
MLDMECFTYLNRALESPMSPYVVLASNRGICTIRGTEFDGLLGSGSEGIRAPHGIPIDLLDRCMIVKTQLYTREEIRAVIEIRARVEGIQLDDAALERLADRGAESSLRYALQLLAPAGILGRQRLGGDAGAGISGRVGVEDVGEMQELFWDARRSAALMGEGELM